jgi:hypothetical protein
VLQARPGYWRPEKYTETFFDCGDNGVNCHGGVFESQCARNSTGPLCKMCLPGFKRSAGPRGVCEYCEETEEFGRWVLGVQVGLCALAIAVFVKFLGAPDKVGKLTRGLRKERAWKLKSRASDAFQSGISKKHRRDSKRHSTVGNHLLLAAGVYTAQQATMRSLQGMGQGDGGDDRHTDAEVAEDAAEELLTAQEDAKSGVADTKSLGSEVHSQGDEVRRVMGLKGSAGVNVKSCSTQILGKLKILVTWTQCLGMYSSTGVAWV